LVIIGRWQTNKAI